MIENELDVLRDVSQRLEGQGIEFMLTGSVAMNYYAQPRMTRDIDLVVALNETLTDAFVRLFESDYYLDKTNVRNAISRRGMFNLIHNETVIKVDVVVLKSDSYRQEEFARRITITLGDFQTWIVSKEDLILKISRLSTPMNDTSPEIQKVVRNKLLARSGTERAQMGSRMFDAARAMVLASFPTNLSEIEKKVRLCERLYRGEINIDAFRAHLVKRAKTS